MKLIDLCETTGTTARNIKRYIQAKLLPPPEGRTRSARYSDSHRRQVIRIESMRAAGLSLEQIRAEFLPCIAPTEGPLANQVSSIEAPSVEHRYQISDGVFIVFATAEQPRSLASRMDAVRRCRALFKV